MKRKLVTYISRGFVAVAAIFAILLFSPAKMGNAATASATTIDPKTTIAELLPADDPNATIVREALANAIDFNRHPVSISDSDTFQTLINIAPKIVIDKPMTDYGPLVKIANTLSGISIHWQTQLTSENISLILKAFGTNRPSRAFPAVDIDLSNNKLDNTQFKALVAALPVAFPKEIAGVTVNHNNISDFSPYLTYLRGLKKPGADTARLWAFGQTGTDGISLPKQKISENVLKIPFSLFPEYRDQAKGIYGGATVALRVYHGDEDYFNDSENMDGDSIVSTGANFNTALLPFASYDFDDPNIAIPIDINGINRLDAGKAGATTYFTQLDSDAWNELEEIQTKEPTYLTGALPDKDTLKITNIPAGSTAIKVRVITLILGGWGHFRGCAQTYKIPLEWDNPAPQPTTPATASSESGAEPVKAVTKQKVVSPIRKIGLYQQPTFTAKARSRWYPRQSRTQRPMFKVLGYAHSKNGLLRYRVKDVSPGASGQTGYITARTDYIVNTYYQTAATKIKVLRGLNSYTNRQLTSQRRHFAKNKIVRVKRLVTHNLTTRYQLPNGQYVSANKRLVIRVK